MKTLKQIIEEVQQYQCIEGNREDCELRTLAIRVNILREISDICFQKFKIDENYGKALCTANDVIYIAKLIEPWIKAVQEKLSTCIDNQNIEIEFWRTVTLSFSREELLEKYEGER